jgi:hypothetical protein
MDSGTSSTSLIFVVIVIIIVVVFATMGSIAINYSLLAYILAVIIVVMTTLSSLYSSERLIAAIASFILFILIFTFFGLRWFKYGLASTGTYSGNYPAVINTCPDYLSVYKNDGRTVCVDTVGIALTGSSLKTLTAGATPTSNNFFTNIYTPGSTQAQMDAMAVAAKAAGLSWEGITDDLYKNWT